MTQVTISRYHSGFRNVSDTFRVGDFGDMRTEVDDYDLPNGYNQDGLVVRDPDGYECAIVLHSSGRPQLISLAGKVNGQPVLHRIAAVGSVDAISRAWADRRRTGTSMEVDES